MNIGTHFSGQPMCGQLIDLLSKRYSIRDVAKLSGKSVSTVQRVKKVSYLQSLFVVISRLFSPFASAVQSDSVRRPIRFRTPSDQIPSAVRRTTTATYRPKAFHIAP